MANFFVLATAIVATVCAEDTMSPRSTYCGRTSLLIAHSPVSVLCDSCQLDLNGTAECFYYTFREHFSLHIFVRPPVHALYWRKHDDLLNI